MKRSDNLRLVFTAAHISKGLKSPLPKKAPFKLACKLNFTFHMLGANVCQRCSSLSPSLWTLAELATVRVNGSIWNLSCCLRTPVINRCLSSGQKRDRADGSSRHKSIARQFWALPFVCTKGRIVFLWITFCLDK